RPRDDQRVEETSNAFERLAEGRRREPYGVVNPFVEEVRQQQRVPIEPRSRTRERRHCSTRQPPGPREQSSAAARPSLLGGEVCSREVDPWPVAVARPPRRRERCHEQVGHPRLALT